ncbi:MAG: motility associated factor glycosyltransferase family protein [Phycisphaerales bacterium]|nr:motility associated factor glycosyltransferase family protein [Phycisphaerales bacterium]MCB9863125.1 motility associated factor glycosyltransferase family protein [Phycisphaerales bacterium]
MPGTATINETFVENMRSLWRMDARLAWEVDQLPVSAGLDVQPSKRGGPTAAVATSDGRTLFLHSRYDPEREAAEFGDNIEAGDAACIVLCGLGLGYHLKAIFRRYGRETVILVSEPDVAAIKSAMEHVDLRDEIASGRVRILTSIEKDYLHDRLTQISTQLMFGTCFAVPTASREQNADFHAKCRDAIVDYAAFAKMSLTTLVRNAEITCRNIANNLPTYVTTPPTQAIRGQFTGRPAILVAAGPSLRKNIDQLAHLKDKAIIIAAQTTLAPLLERGITPHFVTSLDYSDLSAQFFEGLCIPDRVVLVAEPKASWKVIDAFRAAVAGDARIIMLDNVFARRCLGDALAARAPMEPGATVMHLAFYLAQWLGCDPIVLIGQDLGFGGHVYYAPGVAMHAAWAPEFGRFCSLEMREWERIIRQKKILREVPGVDGKSIYTDEQMYTYLQQFERDFARAPQRIIDATEGGAAKRGAEIMPLAEAARQFDNSTGPFDFGALHRLTWCDPSRLDPSVATLKHRLETLDAFESLCQETRDVLTEMRNVIDDPARFNRLVVRVDDLRTLVQQHELMFRMVRDVSQLAELQKLAADRRVSVDAPDNRKRASRQLRRDAAFIDAMLDGCARLRRIFEESIARFDIAGAEYRVSHAVHGAGS